MQAPSCGADCQAHWSIGRASRTRRALGLRDCQHGTEHLTAVLPIVQNNSAHLLHLHTLWSSTIANGRADTVATLTNTARSVEEFEAQGNSAGTRHQHCRRTCDGADAMFTCCICTRSVVALQNHKSSAAISFHRCIDALGQWCQARVRCICMRAGTGAHASSSERPGAVCRQQLYLQHTYADCALVAA